MELLALAPSHSVFSMAIHFNAFGVLGRSAGLVGSVYLVTSTLCFPLFDDAKYVASADPGSWNPNRFWSLATSSHLSAKYTLAPLTPSSQWRSLRHAVFLVLRYTAKVKKHVLFLPAVPDYDPKNKRGW